MTKKQQANNRQDQPVAGPSKRILYLQPLAFMNILYGKPDEKKTQAQKKRILKKGKDRFFHAGRSYR
jgi:hypothetical protein